nr:isocitrate lyase/phosphoenolpyruvate mutase family protein [Hankyongella ginsenosidimutans]
MTHSEKFAAFKALHVPGNPLLLANIWDAGSAKAVALTGAKALATGSWSVAAAHGFRDGEQLPRDLALANLGRILAVVDVPVSIDLESGYGADPEGLPRLWRWRPRQGLSAATWRTACRRPATPGHWTRRWRA